MALLTTLARVKAVAAGDAKIQALVDGSDLVTIVFERVALEVTEATFGNRTQMAQDYYAAHLFSMQTRSPSGSGLVTSQSVGGVSVGKSYPWVSEKSSLGATIYGQEYQRIINYTIPAVRVYRPNAVR